MTFTRHGHHIRGTTLEDEDKRAIPPASCGGTGFCIECTQDEIMVFDREQYGNHIPGKTIRKNIK